MPQAFNAAWIFLVSAEFGPNRPPDGRPDGAAVPLGALLGRDRLGKPLGRLPDGKNLPLGRPLGTEIPAALRHAATRGSLNRKPPRLEAAPDEPAPELDLNDPDSDAHAANTKAPRATIRMAPAIV